MSGYPWTTGDPLLAADLNAAIAGAGGGMYLPITGGTTVPGGTGVKYPWAIYASPANVVQVRVV